MEKLLKGIEVEICRLAERRLVAARALVKDGGGEKAARSCRLHGGEDVFEDGAIFGRNAEAAGGLEVHVGELLAALHFAHHDGGGKQRFYAVVRKGGGKQFFVRRGRDGEFDAPLVQGEKIRLCIGLQGHFGIRRADEGEPFVHDLFGAFREGVARLRVAGGFFEMHELDGLRIIGRERDAAAGEEVAVGVVPHAERIEQRAVEVEHGRLHMVRDRHVCLLRRALCRRACFRSLIRNCNINWQQSQQS